MQNPLESNHCNARGPIEEVAENSLYEIWIACIIHEKHQEGCSPSV